MLFLLTTLLTDTAGGVTYQPPVGDLVDPTPMYVLFGIMAIIAFIVSLVTSVIVYWIMNWMRGNNGK